MENQKDKHKRMTELNSDGNETRGREGEDLLVEIRPESLGQMGWDFGEGNEIDDKIDRKILRG